MTYAEILALPSDANPRLIHASDTDAYYIIAAGVAGSTATVVGNATVPNDAPIQPPQVFVDAMARVASEGWNAGADYGGLGITSINLNGFLFFEGTSSSRILEARNGSGVNTIAFNNNALPEDQINAILASCAEFAVDYVPGENWTLDLSGGTNAAPTGQGLVDKQTLIDAGWTVTTN